MLMQAESKFGETNSKKNLSYRCLICQPAIQFDLHLNRTQENEKIVDTYKGIFGLQLAYGHVKNTKLKAKISHFFFE